MWMSSSHLTWLSILSLCCDLQLKTKCPQKILSKEIYQNVIIKNIMNIIKNMINIIQKY